MKLLITVQAVDRDGDPLLGFFHGWLLSFAPHFEHIHVICLKKGNTALPSNVTVYSLGKETGESRIKYVVRFFRYLWQLRGAYDIVFSHMNPHYIVLAGWYWKWKGVPMLFWRNHAQMNSMTRIAAFFAAKVFYTSPHACTRIFPHATQMPVGIDTEKFQPLSVERDEKKVILLGRLSKVKRPELFMKAAAIRKNTICHFVSHGDVSRGDDAYLKMLHEVSEGAVMFEPGIPNDKTPSVYSTAGVYVNLTPEGSMDKTVLEAAACSALVLVANTSFASFLPDICMLSSLEPEHIRDRIEQLVLLDDSEKEKLRVVLRKMVEEHHALSVLTEHFVEYCRKVV